MQMLNKKDFKAKMLEQYEITFKLSNETLDSMISRGFIPYTQNEVGDKVYNLDNYTDNPDIFEKQLNAYNKTKDYYTDFELKRALEQRDSSFAAVPTNSFNELAKRGLIQSDNFYEVKSGTIFLFSPDLLYEIDNIHAALEELDIQLQAEEVEELDLNLEDDLIEEDAEESQNIQPEKEEPEEEIVIEEYYEDEPENKSNKAKERLKKEEEQRRAENAALEIAAAKKATEEASKTASKTVEAASDNFNSTDIEHYESKENTDSFDNNQNKEYEEAKGAEERKIQAEKQERAKAAEALRAQEDNKHQERQKAANELKQEQEKELNKDNSVSKTTSNASFTPEQEKIADKVLHEDKDIQHIESSTKDYQDSYQKAQSNTSNASDKLESVKHEQSVIQQEIDSRKKIIEESKEKIAETLEKEPKKELSKEEKEEFERESKRIINENKEKINQANKELHDYYDKAYPYEAEALKAEAELRLRREEEIAAKETLIKEREKERQNIVNDANKNIETRTINGTTVEIHKDTGDVYIDGQKYKDGATGERCSSGYQTNEDVFSHNEDKSENPTYSNDFNKTTAQNKPEKVKAKQAEDTKSFTTVTQSVRVPMNDGSYILYESQKKVPVSEAYKYEDKNDTYSARAQAAYVAQGNAISQDAINKIYAHISGSSNDNITVSVVNPDNDSETKKVIYNSKDINYSMGDIYQAYEDANHIDALPQQDAQQAEIDQKVLFAIGIEDGGKIKGDTYIPPAVPTIHPAVFEELKNSGVKYVESNGVKVDINDLAEKSRNTFSVVNNDSYSNVVVAEEIIKRNTSSYGYQPSIKFTDNSNPSSVNIESAQKVITKSAESQNRFNNNFGINTRDMSPEFVPGFISEKHIDNHSANSQLNINTDETMHTSNGFSGSVIGKAVDFTQNADVLEPSRGQTQTRTRTVENPITKQSKPIGSVKNLASDTIAIDFTKPEMVEKYASAIEKHDANFANSLRSASVSVNGTIATVLANETHEKIGMNDKIINVDEAKLINFPETYIKSQPAQAEYIADYLEKHGKIEAAQNIRKKINELSGEETKNSNKTINDDVQSQLNQLNKKAEQYAQKGLFEFEDNSLKQLIQPSKIQSNIAQRANMAVAYYGIDSTFSKINEKGKLVPENIKVKQPMMMFTEKDRLGRKSITVATINSDNSLNITFNANRKRTALTVKGYAPDLDMTGLPKSDSSIIDKTRLAHTSLRGRKLVEGRMIQSDGKSIILNPEWLKTNERRYSKKRILNINDTDELTRKVSVNATDIYKKFQKGSRETFATDKKFTVLHNKNIVMGFEHVVYTTEQGHKVPKKVRSVIDKEQLANQRKKTLTNMGKTIFLYAMPTQELQSTTLGMGYKKLFGRGSALFTAQAFFLSANCKDEINKMNRELFTSFHDNNDVYKPFDNSNAQISFNSAKNRRTISRSLSQQSKEEFNKDITRLSTSALKQVLADKKFEGQQLNDTQLNIFKNALLLRGYSEGDLSVLNVQDYFKSKGIILTRNYNLSKNKDLNALIDDLNILGNDAKYAAILGTVKCLDGSETKMTIANLSNEAIEKLLSGAAELPEELKVILTETLKLRKFKEEKINKTSEAQYQKKLAIRQLTNKMLYSLKGSAFGDGILTIYNSVRKYRQVKSTAQSIIALNKNIKQTLLLKMATATPGSFGAKLYSSTFMQQGIKRRAQKVQKKTQKAADRAAKQAQKAAKKALKNKKRAIKRNAYATKHKYYRNGIHRIGKVKNRVGKAVSKLSRTKNRAKLLAGKLFKPFKMVAGAINGVKQAILKKFLIPVAKYAAIFLGIIIALEIGINLLLAGLNSVYGLIYNTDTSSDSGESSELTAEQTLTSDRAELCINLDSMLKYYVEGFSNNDDVIKNVKKSDAIEDEKEAYYDPKVNDTLNIKSLGTTVNGIQTGLYYTYYNGDGKEIGYKSNAKDIVACANAWIGEDYFAKGIFKSYVEKLWNYSHMVAYEPRLQANGKYVYACSSQDSDSQCYENSYSYYCNTSAAYKEGKNGASNNTYNSRVYQNNGGTKTARTDIHNGSDKNTTYINTKGFTNGIKNYSLTGCQQHTMTYHKVANGTQNLIDVTQKVQNTASYQALTATLPNGKKTNIKFYAQWQSSSNPNKDKSVPAPAGCKNWKSITFAYADNNNNVIQCKAYYCAGCCDDCAEVGTTKVTVNTQLASWHGSGTNHESTASCSNCTLNYCSSATKTVNGTTYSNVLGTSAKNCKHYTTFRVPSTSTSTTYCNSTQLSSCTHYKWSAAKKMTCYYYPQDITFFYDTLYCNNSNIYLATKWSRTSTSECKYSYAKCVYEYGISAVYALKPPSNCKFVSTPATQTFSKYNSQSMSYTKKLDFKNSDGSHSYYYIGVKANGKASNYSASVSCQQKQCLGHTHSNTTYTTYYRCLGHYYCKGHLRNNPQTISLNYCKGYCPGHTLEHYCTGHVDLNIAQVTLFLGDNNDLAYLGIPKKVDTTESIVQIQDMGDILGNHYSAETRDVQTPAENTEYLYKSVNAFKRFDYSKYPLPTLSDNFFDALDLKGNAVTDPGNFGNPLDTIKYIAKFTKKHANSDLDTAIKGLYETFSKSGEWIDYNDAGNQAGWITTDLFNTQGQSNKFDKYHYFDGWFNYSDKINIDMVTVTDDKGISKVVPRDKGPYARATESVKDDWYEYYGISFPGAYNSKPDKDEIKRLRQNIAMCAGTANSSKLNTADTLLNAIGDLYTGNGIDFAYDWYQQFYKAYKGSENSKITTAYNVVTNAENNAIANHKTMTYADKGKLFRKSLAVHSISDSNNDNSIDTAIKTLKVGDLLGAGDEIYVVLYNDTSMREITGIDASGNFIEGELKGIEKGHVIVATVNGNLKENQDDYIHLFSFTTEFIQKRADLFWIYKN